MGDPKKTMKETPSLYERAIRIVSRAERELAGSFYVNLDQGVDLKTSIEAQKAGREVLDKLGLSIPVCGMVKDDNHRTRGLYYQNVEIPIDRYSEGFKLITRIQDEAHRFAIEYHRSLRSKEQVHSVLDDIPGIGPARRKALMKSFQTLEDIKSATEEELSEVEGMNSRAARQVFEFFHIAKNE